MKVLQLQLGPMANFTYLVAADGESRCVAIDPSWDMRAVVASAHKAGLQIDALLLTHGHFDHSKGIETLLQLGIPAYIEQSDCQYLEADSRGFTTFAGNAEMELAGMKIEALHTPGHSPGSVCYKTGGCLFTGDTLFVGELGRVDLPGSSPAAMYHSMLALAALPPETKIYPGHAYGDSNESTIGQQRETNQYMQMALRDRELFLSAIG